MKERPVRVLLVEDSAGDARLIREMFREEEPGSFEVTHLSRMSEAVVHLAKGEVDIVLVDMGLPDEHGLNTMRRAHAAAPGVPVIVLTGLDDEALAAQSMKEGAQDYLLKDQIETRTLPRALRHAIERNRLQKETERIRIQQLQVKADMREQLLQKELEATELRAARQIAQTRAVLIEELERKNRELEAFSYSVSHDLRAPLRAIDGFSQALLKYHGNILDEEGQGYLKRVRSAAQHMGELIDDLLNLSMVSVTELARQLFDISQMAQSIANDVSKRDSSRQVRFTIEEGLSITADRRLMRIVLENLLGNAWKFTSKKADAHIEFSAFSSGDSVTYFVRDNGVGFDMTNSGKLFTPFQRLHSAGDFPGTGIGLATVRRIIDRHGGQVTASATLNEGATFSFTVPPEQAGI